jgi:quinol monooxygenase YgiN
MSGRRRRDDDWDDARRAPSDDRRDAWADDVPEGWADRGRPGGGAGGANDRGDRGLRDRDMGDRGPSDRGMSDRRAGDWGGRDRGISDQGAGEIDFDDWFVGGGKRRGGAHASGAHASGGHASGAHGSGAHGGVAPGSGGQGGYRGPDYPGQGPGDAGRGQPRHDRGGYGESGYGDYRQGRDYPDQGRDFRDETRYDDYGSANRDRYNGPTFTQATPEFKPAVSAPPASGGTSGGRPYGRLSIFTLLDDKASEFDQLTERAAEGVRSLEPDTLVYVIHVVPKAPMQRIIYEIYRDRAAFDAHERQPHILQFVADRKSCVLATNIIDLRLKNAKVAPLGGAVQPASGQAASPAAAQQPARALESGNGPSGDGRSANAGNSRYSGHADGYQESGSGRRPAAGGARYAEGGGRYAEGGARYAEGGGRHGDGGARYAEGEGRPADDDGRHADGDNGWFHDHGQGSRRSGGVAGSPGGDRGQSPHPGRHYGGN